MSSAAVVVIGASAGAIDALGAILPRLPASFAIPVLVVVHLVPTRPSLLVELFRSRCALAVAEPVDKEPVRPGIFFAPRDYHLLVERDRSFALSVEPPVHWSRPSIDVLFESVAYAYGRGVVAVVLTGSSADGAKGAQAVHDVGGVVFVQSPESAAADFMPLSAIKIAHPQMVGTPLEIAEALFELQPSSRERR